MARNCAVVIPAGPTVTGGWLESQYTSHPFVKSSFFWFCFAFLFAVKWQHGKIVTGVPEVGKKC